MTPLDRILLALAGLCGLLGVAASAAAAHTSGGETLKTAAQFLLFHAPLVVGLVALGASGFANRTITRLAGAVVLVGLALFSGDLALRALTGSPLFAYAAPSGGFALMAGWLLTTVAAFVPVRR
ncbi:DUF423 domain-containing protein [Methylobacterium haplocladii]|uniref:Membrane protein n=1 Tax=Methylobacterium haplocladii TaxID=1176176 RepID=A0A512IR10_9HYPH|nr:DUF423 domain-containing protein [Methylobacterium haplocladii]GEP00148.1 membrane protein [Methylobacterium haplocladii]GJD82178.1 hypothetical protein HPGCJGGD_0026 [Methylobacterium haplocladii]GLS60769.1 membrane protein [Methylobacterium haplocladii]